MKARRRAVVFAPLTEAQQTALANFAAANGPGWKLTLGTLWMRAAAPPVLHALRNSHGPAWLDAFDLP